MCSKIKIFICKFDIVDHRLLDITKILKKMSKIFLIFSTLSRMGFENINSFFFWVQCDLIDDFKQT